MIMSGEEIRKKREELDLTQAELAEMLGISIKTLQNYEYGEVIPKSKHVMLRNFVRGSIAGNSINVDQNTGHIAGNNIINVSLPEEGTQKIIKPDGTTIIESSSSKGTSNQSKEEELQSIIDMQKKVIESYEGTIKAQQHTIELLSAKKK